MVAKFIRCNISYCTARGRVIALWLFSYVLLSFAVSYSMAHVHYLIYNHFRSRALVRSCYKSYNASRPCYNYYVSVHLHCFEAVKSIDDFDQ